MILSRPRVWHIKDRNIPKDAIYVGRPSPFGNPFKIFLDGGRDAVIELYEKWVNERPDLLEKIKKELKGKDLVCWCAPKRCHADVLLKIANETSDNIRPPP
jgi:hypothetical protein